MDFEDALEQTGHTRFENELFKALQNFQDWMYDLTFTTRTMTLMEVNRLNQSLDLPLFALKKDVPKTLSVAKDIFSRDHIVPNVLVPVKAGEPFQSGGLNLGDANFIRMKFKTLHQLTDETIEQASGLNLFRLSQMAHPNDYGIKVNRSNVLREWESRGQKAFKELGFPTDLDYPYVNIHTGYKSVSTLASEIGAHDDRHQWWYAIEHSRPVADLSNLPQSNYLVEIRRVLRDPASCEGPWKRYSFLPISIDNEINGFGITPVDQEIFCTSSTAYFEATYVEGEYYTRSVVPDNLGSVVAGQGTRFPTVEWNEIPDGYVFNPLDGLRVSIRKCGIEYLESQYPITLTDDPNLRFVNLPTDICANNIFDVSFTSDIDFDSFNSVATSLFLDGQLIRNATTVLNGYIVTIKGASFNPTNVDYIGEIRLVIIDPSGCNGGVLEETVNVRANPSVDLILTNEPDNYCNTPWIVTLDTQVQGNSSSLFFRWYDENGTFINSGLGLDSIDVTSSSGSSSYTVEVESPNNCIAMDDVQLPFCAPIPPCPNPVPESVLSNVSWSSCHQITATASFDPSVINYSWSIIGSSTAVVLPSSTASSGFFSFNELGNYTIVYEVEYPNGCRDQQAERITVGYQSVLDVNPSCAGNNSYNVQLLNSSPFLIAYQPTSASYTGRNTSTGGAVFNIPGNLAEANLSNLTSGIYEFNLTIDAPNGPPCSLPDPVIVDLRLPDATFSIDDTCTENAINLSPNDPQRDGYTYRWEFNNTANENYEVMVVLPQLDNTLIELVVTDPYGCTSRSDINNPNNTIDVNAATFFGTIEGDGDYCHTDSPILFYQDNNPIVPDPVVLQWFAYGDDVLDSTNSLQPLATGATYSPIISGNYYARAYDIDGCYVELAPALINITQPYSISIPDQGQICSNDDYFLQGFIDASLDDVEYRWTQRTVGSASPPVEILGWTSDAPVGVTINESTAAYYSFTLEVRRKNTTCVTGAASSMYVTDPPVTTLSVSYNCDPNNPYEVELTASNPSSYIDSFLWSDGQMGETIRVNRGGAYQVTSLSTYYNCPIIANVEVRKHPDEFIWVFPSGCYEFCPESIQGEISGPLPDFQEWSWSNDPIGIESGNNSRTDVYDMDVVINNSFIESSLLLYLENPGGCFIESEPLIIIRNNELCTETSERNSLKTGVLKIIPNPTNDRTKIAWEEIEINEKDLFIRVYSLQGVLLVDKKVSPQWSEVEFNASKLKTGTYLVRLEDGFTTYLTGQLIKK
jgi:hypothetical protein